jgi:hypothetical protein
MEVAIVKHGVENPSETEAGLSAQEAIADSLLNRFIPKNLDSPLINYALQKLENLL